MTLLKGFIIFLIVVLEIVFISVPVFAHPGNTASDGCHYCRTNCAKWGEVEGARHCHNSKPAPVEITPKPQPQTWEYNGKTYYSESAYTQAIAEDQLQKEATEQAEAERATEDALEQVEQDEGEVLGDETNSSEEILNENKTSELPTSDETASETNEADQSEDSTVTLLITVGAVGVGAYYLGKRSKKKETP